MALVFLEGICFVAQVANHLYEHMEKMAIIPRKILANLAINHI
jgi:hypothetical protein